MFEVQAVMERVEKQVPSKHDWVGQTKGMLPCAFGVGKSANCKPASLTLPNPCSHAQVFHAIICDPPYGIRAGIRKAAAKSDGPAHGPTKQPSAPVAPYSLLAECLHDLLDAAARLLVTGGRLVYFLPAVPEAYSEARLPRHPALELVCST